MLTILYLIVCLALIVIVLLQSGRSASLGTIAGGAQTLFGKKEASMKSWGVTTYLAIAFMLFTIVLTILHS